MGNMSYCRFRNTLKDLSDCDEALGANGLHRLDRSERAAAAHLIELCQRIAQDFGDLVDDFEAEGDNDNDEDEDEDEGED